MVNTKEFVEQIKEELDNLGRLSNEVNILLSESGEEKNTFEIRAAGSILHDFYCGIEKIFERTAVTMNENVPAGLNWHTQLLYQMGKPVEGSRDNLISEKLIEKLKKYLRFRHLFRNIYGFELDWERVEPLCIDLNNIWTDFKSEIEKFLLKLSEKNIDG